MSGAARFVLLALAAIFSLPAQFCVTPDMGMDPSWQLSLQLAALQSKIFGHDFIFTYGPLGWLMIRADVSKFGLLFYDFFIMAGLLSIYRALLPERPKLLDGVLLLVLALITRACLFDGAAVALFTILCHWLWRIYERGSFLAVASSLATATLLFFGKVNYGSIMVCMIPAFAIGMIWLRPERRRQGFYLLLGFLAAVWIGAYIWHVAVLQYLGSSQQIIAGYNDAMMRIGWPLSLKAVKYYPLQLPFDYELAVPFLAALATLFFLGRRQLPVRGQFFLIPLVAFAAFLLFKNAFVRADWMHTLLFYEGLPLLLAFLCTAWRGATLAKILLMLSLPYPFAIAWSGTELFQPATLSALPTDYFKQALAAPPKASPESLQRALATRYPEAELPAEIRAQIGASSVDVMPWESAVAVRNGLNYRQRPVPQSYSAYTLALDTANAKFLQSTHAPDWILYTGALPLAIDSRPAAWDESITKRVLLENYFLEKEFELSQKNGQSTQLKLNPAFLLQHRPGCRRLVAIATNNITVEFDKPLAIPASTNLIFLTLEMKRSWLGKLQSAFFRPGVMWVIFSTPDGEEKNRAIPGLLATSVLVNRRVESAAETRRWLQGLADENPTVSSVRFQYASPWAFQSSFNGTLVEYRLEKAATFSR